MAVSDAQVQEALDELKHLSLVFETSGSRVARWEHNLQRGIGVPEQSAVLLGLLMLRGPQTAGELRINAERWYRFADISSVEAFLDELQERAVDKGGPLVARLPRASGAREQRWAHLLCGPVAADTWAAAAAPRSGSGSGPSEIETAPLAARVATLETQLAELRAAVQNLHEQLGLSHPGQSG